MSRAASGLRAALVMAPEQAARAEAQGVRRVGELVGALRAAAADSRRSLAAAWRRDPSMLQRELSAWVRFALLFLETKTRGVPSACLLPPILHAGGECCLLIARVLTPVCAQSAPQIGRLGSRPMRHAAPPAITLSGVCVTGVKTLHL